MAISSVNSSPPGFLNPGVQVSQPVQTQPVQQPQPQAAQSGSQTDSGHASNGNSPSLEQVQQATNQINKVVQNYDQSLQFAVDQSSGKVLVQVVDTTNHKVIRQIPSQEAMAISQALDKLQGLLIRQTA